MHVMLKLGLVVLFVVQILGVSSLNLKITPERVRIHKDVRSTVAILCTSDVPLAECQVSWWAEKETPGAILDLSLGPLSKVNESYLGSGLFGYGYHGKGLDNGECGVTMQVIGKKVWTMGCRVRAKEGGWSYALTELLAYSTDPLPGVVVERTSVVVLPGKEVSVMCSAPEPVDACYYSLPGKGGYLDFFKGLSSADSVGRHIYRGSGKQSGQCGLTWRDIGEADNGPVRCYLWKTPKFADNRGIHIIVARAPDNPVLQVVYEGDTVKATCTVRGSRPVADVQWLLGDDVIRNDAMDDSPVTTQDEWIWPWSKTSIVQNLTRTLEPQDYGKVLKCVTSHVVLEDPLEARQTMSKSGDEGARGSGPARRAPIQGTNNPRASSGTSSCSSSTSIEGFLRDRSCPSSDEVCALRLKEAQAALRAAELAEEAGKVVLEAAKSSARAEEARARAEEARAKEEEYWAKNAEEELEYEHKRRGVKL